MTDLSYSIRALRRHPRYTILTVLTLAAGIGVTVAMFGLLDAVYFRPLPLTAPERLVRLTLESPSSRFGMLSYDEVREIEREASAFTDVFAIGQRGVTLNHQGEANLLLIHYVSGRYFPSLGIPMQFGRGFTEADDAPSATAPQVVINHHVWQRLGAPADIIGRTIQLNNTMFTVIGVTARGFAGLDRTVRTDVWVTTHQAPLVVPGLRDELSDRRHRWFRAMGRLAGGASLEDARAQLDVLVARWRASDAAAYADARAVARRLVDDDRQDAAQGAIFLALVGLILLIACANVANLTLARGEARRREVGVRAALGASRGALLRQMLLESALLSIVSTVLGLLLATWILTSLPALLPPGATSLVVDARVDARLIAFAAALTALTVGLVGLVPAWRGSRSDIYSALKGDAPLTSWRGRAVQLRDVLVVGEIALSGVMIIAAALLVRSFGQGLAIDPGFDTSRSVTTFYLVPGLKGYDRTRTYQFLEEARRRAAALPGVRRASYGIRVPTQGNEAGWSAAFVIPGKQPPPGKDAFDIRYTMVGPQYFAVMGTRILRGRGIDETDHPGSLPAAVISESMAREFWPGENPIGRRIRMGQTSPVDREIVGIAQDIRIGGLYEAPEKYIYVPFAQHQQEFGLLFVESDVDPAALRVSMRQQLAQIDPAIPILRTGSFGEHMNLVLYEARRNAMIGLFTAALGLALAAIGLYGLVSLVSARRTREIGIRVALGATRGELVRLLLGRGASLALAGGVLGIAGGVVAGHLLESQLHGVTAADPWSLVLGVAVLASVSLAANVVPAWRGARVDPTIALRAE